MISRLFFISLILIHPFFYGSSVHEFSSIQEREKKPLLPNNVHFFPINEFDKSYLDKRHQNELINITAEKIIEIKHRAKRDNDPFAQCILGILYEYGFGVHQSFLKATEWLEKAGKNGDRNAQFRLGEYYEYRCIKRSFFKRVLSFIGLRKEPFHRFYWYEKAAKQGHAAAQYTIGIMYAGWLDQGEVEVNFSIAKEWLEKSYAGGDERAAGVLEQLLERERMFVSVNTALTQ